MQLDTSNPMLNQMPSAFAGASSNIAAIAMIAACVCIAALTMAGTSTNSRRTVMGVLSILLLATWASAAWFAQSLGMPRNLALTLGGLTGILTVAGMADRARPAALFLGAILSTYLLFTEPQASTQASTQATL